MERDREKTLEGPKSTGFSMSTAAKTTNSTRLKLKEAQDEIGELRRALARQQVASQHESSIDTIHTPEDTPEVTTNASTDSEKADKHKTETEPKRPTQKNQATTRNETNPEEQNETERRESTKPGEHNETEGKEPTPMQIDETTQLGSDLIKHLTDAQVLGAALARKHSHELQQDSDAMEEDEHEPMPIESINTSDASETEQDSDKTESKHTTEVINLANMSSSSSSSGSSASSSSSSSSSSSASSTNEEIDETNKADNSEDNGSMDSYGTQELATRIKTNIAKMKEAENSTTKNNFQLEEPSGAYRAFASLPPVGTKSGTQGDHQPPKEPFGVAGDPPQAAGHGA
jgi:hypothetical protein